jgi:polysaccharide biosynthesis transport protein
MGSASPAGAPSECQTAFKEVELLKIQRAKLSRYLRPKHPRITKLDADIERGEKLLEIFRRQNRDQLQDSRQALQLKTENVQASIKEWESKVVEANSRLADAERLKLNVQREQTVYDRLNVLVQNVGISRNIDQETLAILDPASPPKRSYTQEIRLLSMAGLGGLGLGLGFILLIALRDDRFTSLLEVGEKLGQIVLGQVPEIPSLKRGAPLPLLAMDDKRHLFAESYRNLRSAILFMAIEGERPKVLLITSAVPNEGKSTVAANLARALALGGSRVVLVDADLRKGVLHQLLGLQREPGLAEVLRQPGDLEKVIQKDPLLNFAFIASGRASGNSGDLFLGGEFKQVLARLRQQFDYVLLDSSPIFAADDATTLAPAVDGTLFVVRSRFSGARPVREALELLYHRQAKVLGVVFNQVDASARSYYYYKYADYHAPEVGSP